MGVWRSDWVLIGADIGYDQFDEYKYEEYEKFEGVDSRGFRYYAIDWRAVRTRISMRLERLSIMPTRRRIGLP